MRDNNNEKLWLLKYQVNKTGPKHTVENIKHLKIHHLFDNPKNTTAMTSIQKIKSFKIQNLKILSSSLTVSMPSQSNFFQSLLNLVYDILK